MGDPDFSKFWQDFWHCLTTQTPRIFPMEPGSTKAQPQTKPPAKAAEPKTAKARPNWSFFYPETRETFCCGLWLQKLFGSFFVDYICFKKVTDSCIIVSLSDHQFSSQAEAPKAKEKEKATLGTGPCFFFSRPSKIGKKDHQWGWCMVYILYIYTYLVMIFGCFCLFFLVWFHVLERFFRHQMLAAQLPARTEPVTRKEMKLKVGAVRSMETTYTLRTNDFEDVEHGNSIAICCVSIQ